MLIGLEYILDPVWYFSFRSNIVQIKDQCCNNANHRDQNCNSLKHSSKGITCNFLNNGGPHLPFLQIVLLRIIIAKI